VSEARTHEAPEVIEGELAEPIRGQGARGAALARAATTTLVPGESAADRLRVATEIATELDSVIKTQGLRTKIGSKRIVKPDGSSEWVDNFHIDIEAWQTLAAFLGLAAVPVWTRRVIDPATGTPERVTYAVRREVYRKGTTKAAIKDGSAVVERVETAEIDGYSWEARVEVYKDGALVSAGEAMVSRTEEAWRESDDHACRSMAQTRAASKAIAGVARWIVTLAGYQGTPNDDKPDDPAADPATSDTPRGQEASDELRNFTRNAIGWLLEGDLDATEAVLDKLAAQHDGTLPAPPLQAVLIVATAVKEHRERAARASGDPA
jgi:hypothetical protein